MVKKLATLAAFTLMCACSAEGPARTQLILVAATDIKRLDHIRFTIEGNGKKRLAEAVHSNDARGPHYVGLFYTGGPLGPLTLTATGLVGGNAVVSRVARTSFVEGETRVVPLHLLQSCEKPVACADSSHTCTERGCESADLAPEKLPDWQGEPPSYGQPGTHADSGMDAGQTRDSGADGGSGSGGTDGGMNGKDSGMPSDSGMSMPDGGPTLCDGKVTDLLSDPNHCGRCETLCMEPAPSLNAIARCLSGSCAVRCQQGWFSCDSQIDNGCETGIQALQSDWKNCGACKRRCDPSSQRCIRGDCVPK